MDCAYVSMSSSTATAATYTLSLHDALPILGMSTQLPPTSNFQPWYTHRKPHSSLRPKKSDAPRCGQLFAMKPGRPSEDRKSTRLNSSHMSISYAVFCLKKKNNNQHHSESID